MPLSPKGISATDADRPLAGQTALITGAGRGIGRAIAIRFAAAGAAVVCCARGARDVELTVEHLRRSGGEGLSLAADVRDPEAMERLAQAAVEQFGRLDLAVLNAGVSPPRSPIESTPPSVWRESLDINLTGVYLGLRAVVPHLRAAGGGKVIVVGSGAARRAPPGLGAYVAAKAGVSGLVLLAARELRADNIAINELQPGPTATAMHGVSESNPAVVFGESAENLEAPAAVAGEWFKSPRAVADFALTLMTMPNNGPTGQVFSLNSAV